MAKTLPNLQDVKNQVGELYGCLDWKDLINSPIEDDEEIMEKLHDEVTIIYAKQVLDYVAENAKVVGDHKESGAKNSAKVAYPHHDGWEIQVDKESILKIKDQLL